MLYLCWILSAAGRPVCRRQERLGTGGVGGGRLVEKGGRRLKAPASAATEGRLGVGWPMASSR